MAHESTLDDSASSAGGDDCFNTLGTDILITILCRLGPSDLASCASVSRLFQRLYLEDENLWFALCHRRWGAVTAVNSWLLGQAGGITSKGGEESSCEACESSSQDGAGSLQESGSCAEAGRHALTYRELYGVLEHWEHLIGFWRGVGDSRSGSLVHFEWGRSFIQGFRVVPLENGGYGVTCVPFLRLGLGAFGQLAAHLNTAWRDTGSCMEAAGDAGPTWGGRQEGSDLEGRRPEHEAARCTPLRKGMSTCSMGGEDNCGHGSFPADQPSSLSSNGPYPLPWHWLASSPVACSSPLCRSASCQGPSSIAGTPAHSQGHAYQDMSGEGRGFWTPQNPSRQEITLPPRAATSPGHWSPDTCRPAGVALVALKFIGDHVMVIEDASLVQPSLAVRQVAVDATLTSLGSSGDLQGLGCSPPVGPSSAYSLPQTWGRSQQPMGGSRSAHISASQSPPSGLPYEMYAYLASRVASSGGDRTVRKQRKREKSRTALRGQRGGLLEAEYLVKVPAQEVGPTQARPLQGLWKGLSAQRTLDVVLVSQDEQGTISCRQVAQGGAPPRSVEELRGSIMWTAAAHSRCSAPLQPAEQRLYQMKRHLDPSVPSEDREQAGGVCRTPGSSEGGISPSGGWSRPGGAHGRRGRVENGEEALQRLQFEDEEDGEESGSTDEVVAMYRTFSEGSCWEDRRVEGRVWCYANGRFGHWPGHADFVVDYRRLAEEGSVLDAS